MLHRLERQHPHHLLRLVFARTGTSVAGPWMDHAAGVRTRGDSYGFHLGSKRCATCDAKFQDDATLILIGVN